MRFHSIGSRASGRSAILLSTARRRLLAFAGMPTVEPAGTALFLKRWLRRPFAMGAVVPSGRLLAEAMARATLSVMAGRDGHVIELGAGTGEVTKALLAAGIPAARLALVERDQELAAFLRRHFRGPQIVEGDAARLPRLLAAHCIERVAAVVSSLPLLSLPTEVVNGIVHGVFEALPRGAALVQFTYGPSAPVPRPLRERLRLQAVSGPRIWRNVPPAVVWTFTRPAAA
jgi:phosphatidylethanolamine/phosphatidyl-N-methylethanolamine N-methyltransferase